MSGTSAEKCELLCKGFATVPTAACGVTCMARL